MLPKLAVCLGGIDVFPEYLDQFAKTYSGRVEDNLDSFDMTGLAGTDLFVGRIFNCTAGVSNRRRYNSLSLSNAGCMHQKHPPAKVAFRRCPLSGLVPSHGPPTCR